MSGSKPRVTDYIGFLTDTDFGFGGTGVVVAVVLVVALWVLMPRTSRGKARLPTYLIALQIALAGIHNFIPVSAPVRRALEVSGVFLVLACLGRTSFLLVVDWLLEHRLKRPIPRIFADIVQVVIYIAVAFATFREMGAELGSLLTTSALLTAVIGLSLQETLGNLFAGLAIQAQRPFKVGDWIQIEGAQESSAGRVVEINWRATKILTTDWVEIIFPNGLLAKSPLRNYTQPSPVSRRLVRVPGPYGVLPHRVEAALLEAVRGCPGVLDDPPPSTWVSQFCDSNIEYTVLFFIDDYPRKSLIDAAVRRRVCYAFDRAAIEMPCPIRDVRVTQASERRVSYSVEEQIQRCQRLLRRVDFLDVLPGAALEQLARASRIRRYSPDEDVIRQGEEGAELFIIESGEALVLLAQGEREAAEVARLGPGSVFGEMSLVTGERRNATVRAATPCELIVVGHEAFRAVLEENAELDRRISEVLANRQAQNEQVQSVRAGYDQVTQSGMLLDKIRDFFSLRPKGG